MENLENKVEKGRKLSLLKILENVFVPTSYVKFFNLLEKENGVAPATLRWIPYAGELGRLTVYGITCLKIYKLMH